MYTVCRLWPEHLDRFAHLAFPNLRSAFRASEFVNVGASLSGVPVGLVCAELKRGQSADVRSIVVARASRHQGVATLLLRAIEQELVDCGCATASILCTSRGERQTAIEGVLQKTGWPSLEARGCFCKTDYTTISKAPWMKYTSFPAGYDCRLLSTLSPAARSDIARSQTIQPWFPDVLNPFTDEESIEADSSLVLMHGDEVAGWCVFHRVSEVATQCKSLFVRKELQNRGLAISLLVRAIEMHRNLRRQVFFFDVAFDKVKMVRFVERRMLPYLQCLWTVYRSSKSLFVPTVRAEDGCERLVS